MYKLTNLGHFMIELFFYELPLNKVTQKQIDYSLETVNGLELMKELKLFWYAEKREDYKDKKDIALRKNKKANCHLIEYGFIK